MSAASSLSQLKVPTDAALSQLASGVSQHPQPLPANIRQSLDLLASPPRSALESAGLLPLSLAAGNIIAQLPPIFEAIADGQDFELTLPEIIACIRGGYRPRRTLVVSFESDDWDMGGDVEEAIVNGEKGDFRKVDRRMLPGGHNEILTKPEAVAKVVGEWLDSEFGEKGGMSGKEEEKGEKEEKN